MYLSNLFTTHPSEFAKTRCYRTFYLPTLNVI